MLLRARSSEPAAGRGHSGQGLVDRRRAHRIREDQREARVRSGPSRSRIRCGPASARSTVVSQLNLSQFAFSLRYIRAQTNEDWVAEFASGCELHAADLDNLIDERAGLSIGPEEGAIFV